MIYLISIYIGGALTLLMAALHISFPRIFNWKKDYARITELNRKAFHTIHLALLLLFIVIGIITIYYAKELSACEGISFGLCFLLAMFWLWRCIWQIYYFKGKTMHYVLTAWFFLLFLSYLIPVLGYFI